MAVWTSVCPNIRVRDVAPALAVVVWFVIGGMAQPQARFARECALKEITVITLIEDHGEAGILPAAQLHGAAQTQLRARSLCYAGRIDEALALYDSVLDLGPAHLVKR